jgi:hypothetical protein
MLDRISTNGTHFFSVLVISGLAAAKRLRLNVEHKDQTMIAGDDQGDRRPKHMLKTGKRESLQLLLPLVLSAYPFILRGTVAVR